MALIEGCRHELELTVPVEEIAKATETVLAKIQKKAQLKGFRPGKAPMSVIRSQFQNEIQQDVIEEVIPKALSDRFAAEKLAVVGQPSITELKFEPNEPMVFKAQFDVHPEFDLKEYKGLEVEYEDPQVTEEEIAERLEQIRDSKADYVNIDPRPAQLDDYVVVGIESGDGLEGEPMRNPEMTLQLGNPDTIPAFTEGIVGMSPGESKDIQVSYGEDYGQERLAGKTVTFEVELKFIRRKDVPALDDEFAQSMGDFRTFDEFKEQVKASIFTERQFRAQDDAKNKLIEKLADSHEFAVPETYVDRQLQIQLESYARSLQMQGIDPRQLNLDINKFKESQKDRAIRDVKATLLLDKISEVENVTVAQDDVDREVQRAARQQREPVAAVRAKLEKDGGLDRIANRIRTEKTIALLFDAARKVTPVPAPAIEATEPEKTESES
ncbi:trigger factor [Bryobacter aggregatus]|uniref:trigger factor n=1 Tax=Bryobacter aggregatus TaxID=360054 RepID=UPI0009B5C5D5|nr:trigger factor [Bryobacter aggregatus]